MKRQATLTHDGPEDQTHTLRADFEQLTLTLTQVGGYQSRPNGPASTSFTPASAEAFWKQVEALASKGLRDGSFDLLDVVVWKFTACDGKKTYAASGQINDGPTTGRGDEPSHEYGNRPDPVPPASYADITALFALLKQ
jgi:hypothetical protein